jgi:hypothetical protein
LIAALFLVASGGCTSNELAFPHLYSESNSRVCFPDTPSERRAHEGPFAKALIVHAMNRGTRYELARFDLPKPLPRDKRHVLMDRVEKGLRARPDADVVEVGTIVADGDVTRILSMRLLDRRIGIWQLSFPTPQQMLQVSVVGPEQSREHAKRFLRTVGRESCR